MPPLLASVNQRWSRHSGCALGAAVTCCKDLCHTIRVPSRHGSSSSERRASGCDVGPLYPRFLSLPEAGWSRGCRRCLGTLFTLRPTFSASRGVGALVWGVFAEASALSWMLTACSFCHYVVKCAKILCGRWLARRNVSYLYEIGATTLAVCCLAHHKPTIAYMLHKNSKHNNNNKSKTGICAWSRAQQLRRLVHDTRLQRQHTSFGATPKQNKFKQNNTHKQLYRHSITPSAMETPSAASCASCHHRICSS